MKLLFLLSLLLLILIAEGGTSIISGRAHADATPTTKKPTSKDTTPTTTKEPTRQTTTTLAPTEGGAVTSTTTKKEEGTTTTKKEETTTTKKEETTTTKKEETTTTKKEETTTTRGDKTTTTTRKDDHGDVNCEDLEVCTKYARCAEVFFTGDECEGTCSKCVDTGSYGSCDYFRKAKGGDVTIQCYGDADLVTVPKCKSRVCDQYSTPDTCLATDLCAWVEEGDQCLDEFCGHCIYTHVGCEKHKECYDRDTTQKVRIHRCNVEDVQHPNCNKEEGPVCAECKDLTYDRCLGLDGCAWVDVTDYYEDTKCPEKCGYCTPTCKYGGNNTCAQAQWYYECKETYPSSGSIDETEDGEKDSDSNDDGSSANSKKAIYCQGDTAPEGLGRCYVKDYLVEDNNKRCEQLSYEDCINAAATDNTGGCAFVVTGDCGRACGRCVSIGIACTDYKNCHDTEKDVQPSATYYCDFEKTPEVTDCNQKYCVSRDAESCLKESDHCVWYQYSSLDYRCGWCGFVCDSCDKEKKRIDSAYDSDEFFNGGKYKAICKSDDDNVIKDCYKCYGKKSECANAFCLDQLKTCNADKTCSDRAFKVMCTEFGEQDGSIFYEKLVKEDEGEKGDGITDNEATLNFGQCMKKACFENKDDEITGEYNSQTSLEPVCSFGYAEVDYAFTLCLDATSIAALCKENYARNFQNVVATSELAGVYWRYLDNGCKVFFEKNRRLADVATTKIDPDDVNDPWDRITESTETPEGLPSSENCLSVEISVTYPTQESYKADKEKYAKVSENAYKLLETAQVTVNSWSIECCKEDDVCKNMQGSSSVAVSALLAIIAAVSTLLFV